ncbi:MAG TPA: RidA family protein [Aliidongia sp.]|nr:RidA family protein [Aliidongia sp.]
MSKTISGRVAELGLELPKAGAPAANYVPFVITGNLVFLAGQICQWQGERPYVGKVGGKISVEDGVKAAQLCGLNILAWIKEVVNDDFDRVTRCVRLGGFVNSEPTFVEQPRIVNGCSDLIVNVFGDKGRHARTAVGTNVLPFDVAVEVEAIFEIRS